MKFDYTYIVIGDYLVFEPLIIVSNSILLLIAVWAFLRLMSFKNPYSSTMAWFMLMIGISGIFGALCHSVHYQLDDTGTEVFDHLLFGMHGFSLLSAFFCFRGTLLHGARNKRAPRWVMPLAVSVLVLFLAYSYFAGIFLLITISAGLVLVYSLVVYLRGARRNNETGSLLFVWGIVSAFISILVHSLHISFHAWFNHKDLAHVFMIVSMVLMAKGAIRNSPLHLRATVSPG